MELYKEMSQQLIKVYWHSGSILRWKSRDLRLLVEQSALGRVPGACVTIKQVCSTNEKVVAFRQRIIYIAIYHSGYAGKQQRAYSVKRKSGTRSVARAQFTVRFGGFSQSTRRQPARGTQGVINGLRNAKALRSRTCAFAKQF